MALSPLFNMGIPESLPDLQGMESGGAPITQSPDSDLSQMFGVPTATGAGAPPSNPRSISPEPKGESFFRPKAQKPIIMPEIAQAIGPAQTSALMDTSGQEKAMLMGRLGILGLLLGGAGLPLMFGGAGAANAIQQNRQEQIDALTKQYGVVGKNAPSEPTDLDKARAGEANARADLARDRVLHPEKYRGGAGGEKETRLNAKDFAQERDRMVKASEDAQRAKFGGMTVPYSQLEHDALAADAEESLSPNYPGVKMSDKFKTARDLKEFLDERLQNNADATVKAAILKSDAPTIRGRKIKLTPTMKADMIGYIDAKRKMKGLQLPESEAGTPTGAEIPQKPGGASGYLQNLFRAFKGGQ